MACIGWTGAVRFFGDYCFTVANGDIPTEATMCANWCFQQGHKKVGFFWEQGSSGTRLRRLLPRRRARTSGSTITKEVTLGPNPRGPRGRTCATMREQGVEAIVYGGYGYSTFHFARAFKALDWDPPRVMGTAFMFYSNSNAWAEGLEGWHGVDQLGEDGAEPQLRRRCSSASRPASAAISRNVVVALAYDTARVGHPRHRQRRDRHPGPGEGRASSGSSGCPATNGGPGHLHHVRARTTTEGYKGDFLTIRELRGGELLFDGYYRPEWPSNRSSPLLDGAPT